jgi:hypothetical protein
VDPSPRNLSIPNTILILIPIIHIFIRNQQLLRNINLNNNHNSRLAAMEVGVVGMVEVVTVEVVIVAEAVTAVVVGATVERLRPIRALHRVLR